MKQLLIECLPFKVEKNKLMESIDRNNGRLIVPNMIIQRADVPNKNRRVYSRSILEREMSKIMESIRRTESRGLIGELDHPESNIINLKNACLGVIDYKWNGNDMLGDVELLNTPSGNILKEIIAAGYVPGISSRGLGSVKQLYESDDSDLVEVDDDFELLTFDGVSDPSTHNAYFKTVNSPMKNTLNQGRDMHEGYERQVIGKYATANELMHDLLCELSGTCCLNKI